MAENDEHSFPRIQVQGHRGSTIHAFVGSGLDLSCVRMPEFRLFAIDTESGLQFFGAIIAMIYIIEVGTVEPAMHEEQFGVRFWLGVFEIRSHL